MASLHPTTPADDTEGEEDQASPKEDNSQTTNPNIIDNLDSLPNHTGIDNNNNHSHLLLEGSDPPPPFDVGKKKRRSAKKVLFNKRKNDTNNNNNDNNTNNIHEHSTLTHLDYNSIHLVQEGMMADHLGSVMNHNDLSNSSGNSNNSQNNNSNNNSSSNNNDEDSESAGNTHPNNSMMYDPSITASIEGIIESSERVKLL